MYVSLATLPITIIAKLFIIPSQIMYKETANHRNFNGKWAFCEKDN